MSLLSLEALLERLETWDERRLVTLLRLRPDLLQPSPGDLTTLAVRVGSEASIRQHLQRLDAPTLQAATQLSRAAAQARPTDDADPRALEALQAAGLFFAESGPGPALSTPARLPHIFDSLTAHLPQLAESLTIQSPTTQTLTNQTPASQTAPTPAGASAAVLENASVAAISELLDDVAELLALLNDSPAMTLRTGGVGMRELRRIAAGSARWGPAARTGAPRGRPAASGLGAGTGSDASVGEIGWLLELAAASGLIELSDGQAWSPGRLAQQWSAAARHHQHQLLVSGWLLAPRAPMLLRGPHPSSRIAPTLGLDRQRGDAERLRRTLLHTAGALSAEAAGARVQLYALNLPDDDLPGPDALTGVLPRRLAWDRPLMSARVLHLLPWLTREAERLGLFAVGALSAAGAALLEGAHEDHAANPGAGWRPGLSRLAEQLRSSMPAQVDTILVQSDLTAIATGALSPASAAALADFGQREGHGSVPTYRFSPDSLHRGLTRGWTGPSMLAWLEAHSLTELPASLRTQVEDAARTWRGVQIGEAGAWLRVTDSEQREALLNDPVLGGLGLRVLAEDVLISRAPMAALEQALTAAGFNSARTAEAEPDRDRSPAAGRSPEHTASWSLESSPWEQSPVRITSAEPVQVDEALLTATAAALRQAGRAAASSSSSSPSAAAHDVIGTLRSALAARREVTLTRVSPQGSTHQLSGVPTGMNAGRVRIRVRDDEGEATVMLHRIAAVEETPAPEGPSQETTVQAPAEQPRTTEESNG